MIYYQPTYKDAKFILATTDDPRAIWMVGDKAPTVKPTALLGSIEWTYAILDALGVERPRVIGYETLPLMRKYFKRGIGTTFAGLIPESRFPLFIKPAKALKLFEASIFECKEAMLALIEPDCEVDYSVERIDDLYHYTVTSHGPVCVHCNHADVSVLDAGSYERGESAHIAAVKFIKKLDPNWTEYQ